MTIRCKKKWNLNQTTFCLFRAMFHTQILHQYKRSMSLSPSLFSIFFILSWITEHLFLPPFFIAASKRFSMLTLNFIFSLARFYCVSILMFFLFVYSLLSPFFLSFLSRPEFDGGRHFRRLQNRLSKGDSLKMWERKKVRELAAELEHARTKNNVCEERKSQQTVFL